MEKVILTKKENAVMQILWEKDKPMSAHDIVEASEGELNIHTVQQVLRKMLNAGHIEMAGVGQTLKSLTRLYRPVLSQAEYYCGHLSDKTLEKITVEYINSIDNLEEALAFSKAIEEKKKKLNQKA